MNRHVKRTCFEKYFPTNYVFFDCETITLKNGELECGSVAVVILKRMMRCYAVLRCAARLRGKVRRALTGLDAK